MVEALSGDSIQGKAIVSHEEDNQMVDAGSVADPDGEPRGGVRRGGRPPKILPHGGS